MDSFLYASADGSRLSFKYFRIAKGQLLGQTMLSLGKAENQLFDRQTQALWQESSI
jgi:hypothetical protein